MTGVVVGLALLVAPATADARLTAVAVAPHNGTAAVFDIYKDVNVPFLDGIERKLHDEHYRVLEYSDRRGSSAFATVARPTLPGFRAMAARASVVLIISHGGPRLSALVEEDPSQSAMQSAYHRYLSQGYSKDDIFPMQFNQESLVPIGPHKVRRFEAIYGIFVTASGIEHYFAGAHPSLVVNDDCGSLAAAGLFHAVAYFGYAGDKHLCSESLRDTKTLFGRLTGAAGASNRTTVAAYNLGQFTGLFRVASGSQAVVLSPAITAVEPASAASGVATPGSIQFDAKMTRQTKGLVEVSGCGASISDERWDKTRTLLTFALTVPGTVSAGTMTVRVKALEAVAAPGTTPNDWLDGNTKPTHKSGVVPNGDDYTWQIPCSAPAITLTVSGAANFSYHSGAQAVGAFDKTSGLCSPQELGQNFQYNDEIPGVGHFALEVSPVGTYPFPQGNTYTFPYTDGDRAEALLQIGNQPTYNAGYTDTGPGAGAGSFTMQTLTSPGHISLTFNGGQNFSSTPITVSGTWHC